MNKERTSSERKIETRGSNQPAGGRNSSISRAAETEQKRSVITKEPTQETVREKINSLRQSINQNQRQIQQRRDEKLEKIGQRIGQRTDNAKPSGKTDSVSDRLNQVRQTIKERQTQLKEKRQENPVGIRQRSDENRSGTNNRPGVTKRVSGRAASTAPTSGRVEQLRTRILDNQTRLRAQRQENLDRLRERQAPIREGTQQNNENLRQGVRERRIEPRIRRTENIARIRKRADEIRSRNLQIQRRNLRYLHNRFSYNVVYYDFPHRWWYWPRYEYWYFDPFDNFCSLYARPGFNIWIGYNFGNCWSFGYVHPYYLRKYVFVSLGGYWPCDYSYVRYYWYGWHPYRWYGYCPVARQIGGNTYNYYTYNYYSTDTLSGEQTGNWQIPDVDENTFADVRAKLAQEAEAQPQQETVVDEYFDEAVKAFEVGAYGVAADKLARAMELAPEDKVLPFAYAQSLIAIENYIDAADVLRKALAGVEPEKEGVFFPRGLYPDDDALFEQIDSLAAGAKMYPFDADLQLLLGYQLLGIGETEAAFEALQKASQDIQNSQAAVTLLEILDRMQNLEIQDSDTIIEEQPTGDGF